MNRILSKKFCQYLECDAQSGQRIKIELRNEIKDKIAPSIRQKIVECIFAEIMENLLEETSRLRSSPIIFWLVFEFLTPLLIIFFF